MIGADYSIHRLKVWVKFDAKQQIPLELPALRKARQQQKVSTRLGASVQCLKACEVLHKYGFIHRNLKPANYARGLQDKKRIVWAITAGGNIHKQYDWEVDGTQKLPKPVFYNYKNQGNTPVTNVSILKQRLQEI
uniref:Protein kinase domain-containing protein n=1 Tax=Angiostrongylus cantonensis TaxID=6313 RepID=A0A158P6I0_ANGCA